MYVYSFTYVLYMFYFSCVFDSWLIRVEDMGIPDSGKLAKLTKVLE